MSQSNWKPWWEKVAELDTPHERAEFVRGVAGYKPRNHQSLFVGLIAGYVGGKIAARKGLGRSEKP